VYKRTGARALSTPVFIELLVEEPLPRRPVEELCGPVKDQWCDAQAMRVDQRLVIRNQV
jgi:hypothetical protein